MAGEKKVCCSFISVACVLGLLECKLCVLKWAGQLHLLMLPYSDNIPDQLVDNGAARPTQCKLKLMRGFKLQIDLEKRCVTTGRVVKASWLKMLMIAG